MNWEEIKNVLSNIISSLESLLQAPDESGSEEAVTQVEESLVAAKSLIEKMDGEEEKPEDDEEKKPEDEDMMKGFQKAFEALSDKLVKQLAASEKKSNDRIEIIEKAFEDMLAGMGLVDDPKVEKEKQPKQINKQMDASDFINALSDIINKNSDSQRIEKADGIRGAVSKAFGGSR